MNANKYLVVVRAGDDSLHHQWLGPHKNFDVVVSYYGNNPDTCQGEDVILYPCKGSKWQGLYHTFKNIDLDWRSYRYVWLPDDDIAADCDTINRFFETVDELNAVLAQPALTHDSYIAWSTTGRNPAYKYRKTNFVETMVPCFRSDRLSAYLETFTENVSGWGIDFLWASMINHRLEDVIIVDDTAVKHTRPISTPANGTGSGTGISGYDSKKEGTILVKKYNLSPVIGTYYGVDYNGQRIEACPKNSTAAGPL